MQTTRFAWRVTIASSLTLAAGVGSVRLGIAANRAWRADAAHWGATSIDRIVADAALAVATIAVAMLALTAGCAAARIVVGRVATGPRGRSQTMAVTLDRCLAACTPRLAVRAVALLCGAGLVAPLTGLGASASADVRPSRPPATSRPDQGRASIDLTGLPFPDLPATRADADSGPTAPAAGAPGSVGPVATIVVHAGDSLWRIAERLRPDATTAETAALTDRLYRDNRRAIGPDPDLILPGTRLIEPEGRS